MTKAIIQQLARRFEIKACQRNDFKGVFRLLGQLWPDKGTDMAALQRVYERGLSGNTQIYLCANNGDDVVGFVSLTVKNNLWQAANIGHVDELVVDDKHRGCGLGTQLLDAIIAEARQQGCARVELDSAFHRTKAHQFYERHGFEKRGYLFSKPLI